VTLSCCGTKSKNDSGEKEREIPGQIRKELDDIGGFDALAKSIPPQGELIEKSKTHHALSDPLRLTILYLLRDQPLCVCVIKACIGIAGSKLSYHLNIMKEAGLIGCEQQGNWLIYRLTDLGKQYAVDTA
jgi:ArsR family transcriptional regulator